MAKFKLVFEVYEIDGDSEDRSIHERSQVVIELDPKTWAIADPVVRQRYVQEHMDEAGLVMARSSTAKIIERMSERAKC